jgi:hypothetical protein
VEPIFFDKVFLVINYFIIYTSIFIADVDHVLKWVFLFLRRKKLEIWKATPRGMKQLPRRKKNEMHDLSI